jgi:hypothetical protein
VRKGERNVKKKENGHREGEEAERGDNREREKDVRILLFYLSTRFEVYTAVKI